MAVEKLTAVVLVGLISWSMFQVARSYPSSFFPRFADEAVYVHDVQPTATLFINYQPNKFHYAPAKLGYGLPLAASVALFGPDGAMYFSTLLWLGTLAVVGTVLFRRVGVVAAAAACSLASFSPLFGKYATEVGPTTLEAFAFVLLWAAMARRRFWLSGVCLGLITFVDFKWALPAALAFVLADLVAGTPVPLKARMIHIALTGAVAVGLLGLVVALHPTYAAWLSDYAFRHSALFGFDPSPIVACYLWLFGAVPAVALAAVIGVVAWRQQWDGSALESHRSVWQALTIALVPIVFHSLFGIHKGLRFFAVLFPLLAVPVGAAIAGSVHFIGERLKGRHDGMGLAGLVLIPLATLVVVHGGSDGPARHLALPAGYQEALERLWNSGARDGTVSSYNWEAVAYGWPEPTKQSSFAIGGLRPTDRWIALDGMLDRVTVEYRLCLARRDVDVDTAWVRQRNTYVTTSDSLFSVRSDFYASDYFLCELVTNGIGVLQRWHALRPPGANFLTIYRVNEREGRIVRPPGG